MQQMPHPLINVAENTTLLGASLLKAKAVSSYCNNVLMFGIELRQPVPQPPYQGIDRLLADTFFVGVRPDCMNNVITCDNPAVPPKH